MRTKGSVVCMLVAFALMTFFTGCSGTSPEYSKYRSDIKYQMQEMINVLNAGHNTEFMEKYVDPTYIQKMGGLNQALIPFGAERSRALQTALKIAKGVDPTYDPKNKQMSYFNDDIVIPIVFKQVSGKWYLQDDWLRK